MTRRLHRRPADLLVDGATPATPSELSRWTGMSDDFVRDDIVAGVVRANNVARPGAQRAIYVIPVDEAVRYLQRFGVLN